jgi:hypothetical protein
VCIVKTKGWMHSLKIANCLRFKEITFISIISKDASWDFNFIGAAKQHVHRTSRWNGEHVCFMFGRPQVLISSWRQACLSWFFIIFLSPSRKIKDWYCTWFQGFCPDPVLQDPGYPIAVKEPGRHISILHLKWRRKAINSWSGMSSKREYVV